jgi:hypothetical protein
MGLIESLDDVGLVAHCKARHSFTPEPGSEPLPAYAIIRLREVHTHVHMDLDPGPDHMHSPLDDSVIEKDT